MTRAEVYARGGILIGWQYKADQALLLFEDRDGTLWLCDDDDGDCQPAHDMDRMINELDL